jgi:hypothetical protein
MQRLYVEVRGTYVYQCALEGFIFKLCASM